MSLSMFTVSVEWYLHCFNGCFQSVRNRTDKTFEVLTEKLISMLFGNGALMLAVTEAPARGRHKRRAVAIMFQTFSIGDKSGELGGQSSGGM